MFIPLPILAAAVLLLALLLAAALWGWLRRPRPAAAAEAPPLEEEFSLAFQTCPIACSIVRLSDGQYVAINQSYSRTFGWHPDEVIGRTSLEVGLWPDPAARRQWIATLREAHGKILDRQFFLLNKWGKTLTINLSCKEEVIRGEHYVIAFLADITERRLAEAELARYQEKLENMVRERTQALADALQRAQSANQAKSTFLTNVSHELRTPINAIQGFIHLALNHAADPAQKERLDRAGSATDDLAEMIDSLIDLSRLEANRIRLETADFATAPLLDQIILATRPAAQAKGLDFRREIASGFPPALHGDARRLAQIIKNLLTNAVKFTERGSVTLRATHQAASPGQCAVRWEVEDTGIGIAAQDIERLFQPFEQADSSITRRHGGMGIDLSLSRAFARLMKGDLGVYSIPGSGSTFWLEVTLPIASLPAQAICAPALALAPPAGDLPPGLNAIDGLDTHFGLTLLRGKTATYLQLLRQYGEHHGHDLPAIRQALAEDDRETARRLAHSLKGASGALGIVAVQQPAAALEAAIRNSAPPPALTPLLDETESAYRGITGQIQACLPNPPQTPPQAMEPQATRRAFSRLEHLLADDNVGCIAAAREEECSLLAILGTEHATFIHHLENFDFQPALALLRHAMEHPPSLAAIAAKSMER